MRWRNLIQRIGPYETLMSSWNLFTIIWQYIWRI